jgi:hypothetical protein
MVGSPAGAHSRDRRLSPPYDLPAKRGEVAELAAYVA